MNPGPTDKPPGTVGLTTTYYRMNKPLWVPREKRAKRETEGRENNDRLRSITQSDPEACGVKSRKACGETEPDQELHQQVREQQQNARHAHVFGMDQENELRRCTHSDG